MKHAEISKVFDEIKNQIMKGKPDSAIEKLGKFISELNDDVLENQILSLASRYSRCIREQGQGATSEESRNELNSIDKNLINLLREAKEVALEKASMMVGSQLSELAEEGSNAIEELKKLNIIIAESRLLEFQVIRSMFERFFSATEIEKFDQNIDSLKKVLNKEADEDPYKENSRPDFFNQLYKNFEAMPGNKPSIDEIKDMAYEVARMIKNESFKNTQSEKE